MDSSLQHLLLAAFLHDIGKVMQRAEVETTPATENRMAKGGPTRDGHSTHYHVQWTDQFFDQYGADCGLPVVDDINGRAAEIAFRHHNPSTVLQHIVAEADRLSSGMERGEQKYEKNIHKKARMIPLRFLLTQEGNPSEPFPKLPLCPLTSKDQSNYPLSASTEEEWLVDWYKKLWEQFLRDWTHRRAKGIEATLACLDALYERCFWSVPASTIDLIPDNSLYEHSRTAAAAAAAMYLYHRETDSLQESAVRDRTTAKYLLVAGDLSGIQKYIFSIAHAGGGKVAKRLRARSFLIDLMTKILAYQILNDAGLPFLNIILSAGGKFHLLLPNTEKTKEVLIKREKECQTWLFANLHGTIALNLAQVSLTGEDFFKKRIGKKFVELAAALAVKKHQPLHMILTNNGEWDEERFVLPPEAAIQEESHSGYYETKGFDFEEKLGRLLPKTRCFALFDSDRGNYPLLGWSFSVAERAGELDLGARSLFSFQRGKEDEYPDAMAPVHYLYRASHVPVYQEGDNASIDDYVEHHPEDPYQNGQILAFNAIAQAATGRKAIGYLKADVDNLGLLLQKGLDWNEIGWTLSKMATFSRSLEFFFCGRVNHLLRKENYNLIYTVFSGGDDVLLVGPWDRLHDFARSLQREWKSYTANNPHLTLSLGIHVTQPMTPVWAAAAAEAALEQAKRKPAHRYENPKDQFCAFGHLMKWGESDAIFAEIETLSRWLQEGKISSSFARNLVFYSQLADMFLHEGIVEGLRFLPLLSYTLSRNVKDDAIRLWAEQFKRIEGNPIRHLGFIATYSMYLNRR
jgi:CRISPR-associated protein Csm1